MTRGQDGSLFPFLYDSFIRYSLPVYPGSLDVESAAIILGPEHGLSLYLQ